MALVYGQPFGVDVAFGDPILGEPDVVVAEDVLAFAGIAPPTLCLSPIETHIAEKLHAYTMPCRRPNSRVKDLPDIALLATAQAVDAKGLRAALDQTFAFRKTHPLPAVLPDPLFAWATPYAAMARQDLLAWPRLDDITSATKAFLDPVLAGGLDATWAPLRTKNCDAGSTCSESDKYLGIELRLHLVPDQAFCPWISVGVGYEWLGASETGAVTGDGGLRGRDYDIELGTDVRVMRSLALGPYVGVRFGNYGNISGGYYQSADYSIPDSEQSTHGWWVFGVRGAFTISRL